MHEKLISSVKSFSSWTDKILAESKGRDWRLEDFIRTYAIMDLQKFYDELSPFVTRLNSENKDRFENIVNTFESNRKKLLDAMKDNYLFDFFLSISLNVPFISRSADDLVEAIRQINLNAQNLEYALKIANS